MNMLLTKRLSLAPVLPFSFLLLTLTAFGQSSTATLSGTVEDQNGAVVPSAAVTIHNRATSLERHATTNESGSFTIPFLPPGEYTVLVEREGFTRLQLTNIVLNVGDQKAVAVQLKVGDVTSDVLVTADASLVRTDGSVGTVINEQFVRNIPLNGRSFQSLLALTPGVTFLSGSSLSNTGGEFSVNGQRTNSNYFTVDGLDANTGSLPPAGVNPQSSASIAGQVPGLTAVGTTASLVAVDALQEFRIQTSSYAPEFGRQPGGQVQLVTKGGTNEFHGTAFEYLRNEAFDAADWFVNARGLSKPPTRQHQFGGTFGGPLPFFNFGDGGGPLIHSGKDRTHFFFSYEGLRLQLPKVGQVSFPSLCFRGDAPCAGGRIAAHPLFQRYLKVFPIPNGTEVLTNTGQPTGFARHSASYADPSSYDATSIRIDHTAGPVSIFGRYQRTPSVSTARSQLVQNIHNSSTNSVFAVGSTWTISRAVVNDLRFNRSTADNNTIREAGIDGGVLPESLGFLGRSVESGAFSFSVTGLPGPSPSASYQIGQTFKSLARNLNIVDNLIWTAGDHQLKFGGDFRRVNPLLISDLAGTEALTANLAGLTANRVQTYSINTFDTKRSAALFDNFSLYAQDTWRVNRRLTVTYGARWEFVPPPRASEGELPPVLEGPMDASLNNSTRALAPLGTSLWRTRYNNFAPRVGGSYLLMQKPGRELVVRGGVGIFYDLGLGNSGQGFGLQWPNTSNIAYPITGHADPRCRTVTPTSGGIQLALPLPACALVEPVPGVTPPSSLPYLVDRNIVLPRVYQWNASVEQSLGSHQSVTVSYVGAAGRELLSQSFFAPGVRLQGFTYSGTARTVLLLQRNDSLSDYKAMQVQFQRRLKNGLQVLASYTYSSAKDTASADVFSSTTQTEAFPFSYLYGYSDFDVRHNFNSAVTYQIPTLRGIGLLETVTRDWGIDLRFGARSGFPINPVHSVFVAELGDDALLRVDRVEGRPFWIDNPAAPGGRQLNFNAFRIPSGVLGNLTRGIVRGFPSWQADASLHRDFPLIKEKVRLQLRWDVFNVTNTPSFANLAAPRLTPTTRPEDFGLMTQSTNNTGPAGGLNALYRPGGPRSMQFSARIVF